MKMEDDIQKVALSADQLKDIVAVLGARISREYQDKNLLLVGILKGSIVLVSDLMRAISIPCAVDFITVCSYGNDTQSCGHVKLIQDLTLPVEEYDVLVVEDIAESGQTLHYILELLRARGAKSVKLCALFDKPQSRKVDLKADYVGAQAPDGFLVGYGLDYAQKYRNLPFVGVLKSAVYEKETASESTQG